MDCNKFLCLLCLLPSAICLEQLTLIRKSPEVTAFCSTHIFSPNTAYFSLETFVSPTPTGDQRVWSLSRLIFLQNPQPEPESPVQRVGGGRDGGGERQQQRDHHGGAAGQRYRDGCSRPARALVMLIAGGFGIPCLAEGGICQEPLQFAAKGEVTTGSWFCSSFCWSQQRGDGWRAPLGVTHPAYLRRE